MKVLEEYLSFLTEVDKDKEIKIHPRRKEISSIAAIANPVDDIVLGGSGAFIANKLLPLKGVTKLGKNLVKGGKWGIGAAVGIASGAAVIAGYRLIRSWFDQCTKECGTFKVNTPKRQLCMLQCSKKGLEKQILLLRQHHGKIQKIKDLENKLYITNKKIVLYQKFLRNKK